MDARDISTGSSDSTMDTSEDSEPGTAVAGCDTIEHSDMSESEGKLITLAAEDTILVLEGT